MTVDAKFWDDIAEKYAARPVQDVPAFERKKAITRQHLRPGSTVLEIGCGTGSLALEMAPSAGHIDAIDISEEMLRIARGKQQSQGITNVTFRRGSLDESSPYPKEHFDSVWAYSSLHLIPNRLHVLRSIFELMKPGGVFLSSNVCLGDSWVPYRPILAVMRWLGKAPPVQIYGRGTIFGELREAGFVDVEEKDVGADKTVAFIEARKPERS